MSIFSLQHINESVSKLEQDKSVITTKALKEKTKAINNTIEALLNKKVRIDLEIKKQQIALKQVKKQASKEMKLSLKLESLDPLTPEQLSEKEKTLSPQLITESILLDQELDRADDNLASIQKLEEDGHLYTVSF